MAVSARVSLSVGDVSVYSCAQFRHTAAGHLSELFKMPLLPHLFLHIDTVEG